MAMSYSPTPNPSVLKPPQRLALIGPPFFQGQNIDKHFDKVLAGKTIYIYIYWYIYIIYRRASNMAIILKYPCPLGSMYMVHSPAFGWFFMA